VLRGNLVYVALRIGVILCWALAIGLEFAVQKWKNREKTLNKLAMCFFAFALIGEGVTFWADRKQQARLEAEINAQGVPAIEWFHAKDTDTEIFTLSSDPIAGSVELLINGLIEPNDIYTVSGRSVTLSTPLTHSDEVIIRYRRMSTPN
jgi:hypothetical protein